MAIKNANKYTNKNRPSGYYMVNGKRRYWSKENGKYYLERIGSTDDTLKRRGIPNPAGRIKEIVKGKPGEKNKRLNQLKAGQTRPRSSSLPSDYKQSELQARAKAARSRGQGSNIPANENKQPAQAKALKKLRAKRQASSGSKQNKNTNTQSPAPQKPKHGAHSDKIKTLMKAWKSAKTTAEKDRLGKQIHRLKYEKTGSGLKIRKKKVSSSAQAGWSGRSER